MVYDWKFSMPVKAQIVGEHFETLEAEHGKVTPKIVLESARSETSVIHSCFEWDNNIAAEKFRETQAGTLIRNLVVTVKTSETAQSEPLRAFINIKTDTSSDYISIHNVLKDEALSMKMLETAKRELQSFKSKYATLSELAEVFGAITKLCE